MLTEALDRTVRLIRRSPGFTLIAVLSLATGLGLSTAALALVEGMRRGPDAQIPDIDRIVTLRLDEPTRSVKVQALEEVAALRLMPDITGVSALISENRTVEANGNVSRSYVARVAADFFQVVGIKPAMGRLPLPDEIVNESVVVVSAKFWLANFGTHASLSNAVVHINDRPYPVVGVLPPGGSGTLSFRVMLPMGTSASLATTPAAIVVKMRAGVTAKQLAPSLDVLAARLVGRQAPNAPRPTFRVSDFHSEQYELNDSHGL